MSAGAGVCVEFVNGVLVPDFGCSASNIGATCGQYKGTYIDALGYTCHAITYSGGTAYPSVPSTISGLGACNTQVSSEGFYPGVGGVFNPAWVQAGIQAGGGTTPYYETFKKAGPAAYTWQYDDKSGGRSCSFTGASTEGFAITFCSGLATAPEPPRIVHGSGKAQNVGSARDNGNVRIRGQFTLRGGIPLDRATLTLGHLLDELSGIGEVTRGAGGARFLPVTLKPRSGSTPSAATYETPTGERPSVKVEVKNRDPKAGLMEFSITVDRVTISKPGECAGGPTPMTRLESTLAFQVGGDQVLVAGLLPWQCRGTELRTP